MIEKVFFDTNLFIYAYTTNEPEKSDALILSSALESGCRRVCSEDMRHGQIIEDSMLIENPFLTMASSNSPN